MTKDELIAKQQLEIESQREYIAQIKDDCKTALAILYRPEQWSKSCPDFPDVAMSSIVSARMALEGHLP